MHAKNTISYNNQYATTKKPKQQINLNFNESILPVKQLGILYILFRKIWAVPNELCPILQIEEQIKNHTFLSSDDANVSCFLDVTDSEMELKCRRFQRKGETEKYGNQK